jgi:hypothetical protein
MQRAGHLRAQPYKEELQGLPTEGGLTLAVLSSPPLFSEGGLVPDRTALVVVGHALQDLAS